MTARRSRTLTRTLTLSITLSITSLLALPACKSKDAGEQGGAGEPAKTDEAKAGAAKADEPAAGDAAVAAPGTPPGGRAASDNLAPIVELVAGLESCKLASDGGLDGDCPGYDKFTDAVSGQEDAKAVNRTLVNLLGDQNELVRWAAADQLGGSDWQSDPALVATALVALATETNTEIAANLADDIGGADEAVLANPSVSAGIAAALAKLSHRDAFNYLLPDAGSCTTEACVGVLLAAAKQNPALENRGEASLALLDLDTLHADTCATVSELVVALSKEPAAGEDAEFSPHEQASTLIYELRTREIGEGDAAKNCHAVLPGLLDEAITQAKAGSLDEDVFYAVVDLEQQDNKKDYLAKLTTLAEAVAAGAKYSDDMKQTANDALADWKAE